MSVNDVDRLRPAILLKHEVLAFLPGSLADLAIETVVVDTFEVKVRAPDGNIVVAKCATPRPYRRLSSDARPALLIKKLDDLANDIMRGVVVALVLENLA